MIAEEKQTAVKEIADKLYDQKPDWITFYREILGMDGHRFANIPGPGRSSAAFEQSPAYQEILRLLTMLRQLPPRRPSAIQTVRRRREG